MFRTMRRKNQQVCFEEAEEMLRSAEGGVLALEGDGGYPYAVPMSHVYLDGILYFHSAAEGHKADAARRGGKASFCAILRNDVVPSRLTTYFESVIAFGRVRAVESEEEKRKAITALARRYAEPYMPKAHEEIEQSWDHLLLIALDVEHMTGKICRELMEKRR